MAGSLKLPVRKDICVLVGDAISQINCISPGGKAVGTAMLAH